MDNAQLYIEWNSFQQRSVGQPCTSWQQSWKLSWSVVFIGTHTSQAVSASPRFKELTLKFGDSMRCQTKLFLVWRKHSLKLPCVPGSIEMSKMWHADSWYRQLLTTLTRPVLSGAANQALDWQHLETQAAREQQQQKKKTVWHWQKRSNTFSWVPPTSSALLHTPQMHP